MASTAKNLTPGMVINIRGALYKVDSAVKVTAPKGQPFVKARLCDLSSGKVVEKNFKLDQAVKEVALEKRRLEFLYPEKNDYFFLDIDHLDHVLVSGEVVSDRVNYLKEGTQVTATFYGDKIFSVELPQFLEVMIVQTEGGSSDGAVVSNSTQQAVLETGGELEVPGFIEVGDMVKVDTTTNEYIQRI